MSAYNTARELTSYWRTADGRTLPVEWMQTQHLCHTFNKLCRDNRFTQTSVETRIKSSTQRDAFYFIYKELEKRGSLSWIGDGRNQLAVRNVRETPAQLCMLRAIIDSCMAWPLPDTLIANFMVDPQKVTEEVLASPVPTMKALFAEYRLDYPG